MHVCEECGGEYDDSYRRCPHCQEEEIAPIDRRAQPAPVKEATPVKNERRPSSAFRWPLLLSGVGILMVVVGNLWLESLREALAETTSITEIARLANDGVTAGYMVQYGLIFALACMFVSILFLGWRVEDRG